METSVIISIISVVIAFSSLPISYFVAIRQVKIGLDEHERRTKKRVRNLVAENIGEFFKIFYTAVKQIAGIEQSELQARLKDIDPYLKEIDEFVIKTQVLDRLGKAIDDLFISDGLADFSGDKDLVKRIHSIRNQITLGSNTKCYVCLDVISACGGLDLESVLKKI